MHSPTIPASATAGWRTPTAEPSARLARLKAAFAWRRSLLVRLIVLALIFIAVPVALYREFESADAARRELLLASIRAQGTALAQALKPTLARADFIPYFRLNEELAAMRTGDTALKLLFRPASPGDRGFFYVAAAPAVEVQALEAERRHLAEAGVLGRLTQSCDGDMPVAIRIDRPQGGIDLLTSIVPVKTTGGCWVLVVASDLKDEAVAALGRPYWRSPEVVLAGLIYLALAAFVLVMLFDLWRGLAGFGRLAREVRAGADEGKFADRNSIPELAPVADELDRLVESLRGAADSMRHAAEENVHAFKTPLATIRQALEPLRRRIDPSDERAYQAAEAIEMALQRLDGMIVAARDLDRATADTLDPPRDPVALDRLLTGIAEGFRRSLPPDGPYITAEIARGVTVQGSEEILETAIENLIENAISFSPPKGEIRLRLATRRGRAILDVEDEGPGVPPDRLERIFERYYSDRSGTNNDEPHFGLGLWLVRRNVEALGGRVTAENRRAGGFRITIDLPVSG
jgi:two-component system sensor histidine kinase ChvG